MVVLYCTVLYFTHTAFLPASCLYICLLSLSFWASHQSPGLPHTTLWSLLITHTLWSGGALCYEMLVWGFVNQSSVIRSVGSDLCDQSCVLSLFTAVSTHPHHNRAQGQLRSYLCDQLLVVLWTWEGWVWLWLCGLMGLFHLMILKDLSLFLYC